jgi:hypothetical protein
MKYAKVKRQQEKNEAAKGRVKPPVLSKRE